MRRLMQRDVLQLLPPDTGLPLLLLLLPLLLVAALWLNSPAG